MSESLKVDAVKVDKYHIYYQCQSCATIRGGRQVACGLSYLSSRPTIHLHGSGGDTSNRLESRSSHCAFSDAALLISIDDSTVRG